MEGPEAFRRKLDRIEEVRSALSLQVQMESKELEKCQKLVEQIGQAQLHLQNIAQETQQQSHKKIAKIVSKCLSAVFEEPYELKIVFERKRGRTEAEFVYLRDGRKVSPTINSGGVLSVTSLALRLTCIALTLPAPRRLLVLDEPFQGLSDRNLAKMAVLVETLSKELDVQFLIVTHSPHLKVGKVIELSSST